MPTNKNKIKYKLRKQPLTDSEINQHKDFGKLITNYQKVTKPLIRTPLYKHKNRNVFLAILIILLLLWLLFSETMNEESNNSEQDNTEQIEE